MNNVFLRNTLLSIYKSFVGPYLDYRDIHQPSNKSMNSNLGFVQYRSALAFTGAIKGTSR